LKNLSIREISYKLQAKGIAMDLIEEYINNNLESLLEYEKKSAQNIFNKKYNLYDELEIKQYLIKKGYKNDSIKECFNN